MKPTCSYYNELRAAIIDYISNEATTCERNDAYRVITRHIRAGSLADDDYHDALLSEQDELEEIRRINEYEMWGPGGRPRWTAREHDALQADYDATVADFEAGTGRR